MFLYLWDSWQHKSGIIIAGLAQPKDPQAYCQAIAFLSNLLSFPVLAEALSPVRNYADFNPYLISTYDSILRQDKVRKALVPDVVIQIGELPTSKQLRQWLRILMLNVGLSIERSENFDPLHGKTIHLHSSIEEVVNSLDSSLNKPATIEILSAVV